MENNHHHQTKAKPKLKTNHWHRPRFNDWSKNNQSLTAVVLVGEGELVEVLITITIINILLIILLIVVVVAVVEEEGMLPIMVMDIQNDHIRIPRIPHLIMHPIPTRNLLQFRLLLLFFLQEMTVTPTQQPINSFVVEEVEEVAEEVGEVVDFQVVVVEEEVEQQQQHPLIIHLH